MCRKANQKFVEFAAGAKEVNMKRYAGMIALAIAMAFGVSVPAYADGPGRPESAVPISPAEIKGAISKIDGDHYVVKDLRTGKDVEFAIEKDVKAQLERPLKVGDQVEAQLTPEGYAKAVVLVANQDTMDKGAKEKSGPKDIGTIQAPGPTVPSDK